MGAPCNCDHKAPRNESDIALHTLLGAAFWSQRTTQGEQKPPVWQEPWAQASPFSKEENLQTEEMQRYEEEEGMKNPP